MWWIEHLQLLVCTIGCLMASFGRATCSPLARCWTSTMAMGRERERQAGRQAGRQRAWVTWSKHALFMCVICLYFPISSHKRAWSIPQAFLAVASLGGAAGSVPILVYVRSLIRNWPWLGLKKKHQHQNGGFHKWDIPKTDGLWKILLKWMIWRYREVLPFQKTSLNRNCRA